jgi:hypothetical protein
MKHRLPLVLSALALVISLLGAAALGMAASSAQIVPLAKTSNYAKNAGKLNGHKSSTVPRAGQIPVVGATGRLPETLGAVGPKGDPGPQGPAGLAGYQRIQQQVNLPTGGQNRTYSVQCPGGKSVLSGGFALSRPQDANDISVTESTPTSDSVWEFGMRNTTGQAPKGSATLTAVCAAVG